MGGPLQVVATLGVGVRSDAQAVGGVELLHQEGAARLDHGGQLEQAGGGEQRLDGVLPQLQAACFHPERSGRMGRGAGLEEDVLHWHNPRHKLVFVFFLTNQKVRKKRVLKVDGSLVREGGLLSSNMDRITLAVCWPLTTLKLRAQLHIFHHVFL